MSFFPAEGANSAPPNPLVGFEEPFRGGERERKGKKDRENERTKGTEETRDLSPPK